LSGNATSATAPSLKDFSFSVTVSETTQLTFTAMSNCKAELLKEQEQDGFEAELFCSY